MNANYSQIINTNINSKLSQTIVIFSHFPPPKGGTAMNFSVAVDFTASNGNPRDPRSLHHFDPNRGENQYTTAIRSVGSIIEDYDADRLFPALGFGAKVPPTGQVSHEFFLNLRQDNPFCAGVQGLLQVRWAGLSCCCGNQIFTSVMFRRLITRRCNTLLSTDQLISLL